MVITTESNGNGEKRSSVAPMEMESFQPMPVQSSIQRQHPIDQLWMLLKLYIEYYPKISTTIALTLIVVAFFAIMSSFQHPLARNRLTHDYSTIDRHYNFKASQIDHWCLFVSGKRKLQYGTVLQRLCSVHLIVISHLFFTRVAMMLVAVMTSRSLSAEKKRKDGCQRTRKTRNVFRISITMLYLWVTRRQKHGMACV